MNRILCALLLSSGLSMAGDLKIVDAWLRAVPPSSKATAVFMTIINTGATPALITGGPCRVAGEIQPMLTTKQDDGVMGMAFVKSFTVPARGKRVLEPGGDHLMLMKLSEVPRAGATVPLVLTTESGGKPGSIRLDVPVR